MNATELAKKQCVPCRGGTAPLSAEQANAYLAAVPEWRLSADGKQIARTFTFKDFVQAMKFVNKVSDVAEAQGHHPDIHIHWTKVWVYEEGGAKKLVGFREVQSGSGYGRSSPLEAHFGLGKTLAATYRVEVYFPAAKKRIVKEKVKPIVGGFESEPREGAAMLGNGLAAADRTWPSIPRSAGSPVRGRAATNTRLRIMTQARC